MALIEWRPSFSVSVPALDNQHKRLISLINELHAAMLTGKGSAAQAGILAELIHYTQGHFDAEEAYMRSVQFAGFPDHRLKHEMLTREVLTFQKNLEAGNVILSIDLMNFLRDWLQNHIAVEDSQYAAWVKRNAASAG